MIRAAGTEPPRVEMTEVTPSAEELAVARARRATFLRNSAWASERGAEISRAHAGRFICVAGGELFVADSPREAHRAAEAAHPAEIGATFSTYVPAKPRPKIYAHHG
jgi:hypothetical protein